MRKALLVGAVTAVAFVAACATGTVASSELANKMAKPAGRTRRPAGLLDHPGMIRVNMPTSGVDFHAPFGGEKQSSFGPREQGKAARELYTTTHTITIGPAS